jgi:hypothetical protein
MDFNLTVVHCIDLLLSSTAFVILWVVLKKVPKNDFITTMLVLSMALMLNISLFSGIFLIDNLDKHLYSSLFYSWWDAFIRMQDITTVLLIGILALLRVSDKELTALNFRDIVVNIFMGHRK